MNSNLKSGASASIKTGQSSILVLLQSMDQFLLSDNRHIRDRQRYQNCPEVASQEVFQTLLSEGEPLPQSELSDLGLIKEAIHKARISILVSANSLFKIFLPANFQGPTISKFWGAIERILKVLSPLNAPFYYDADDYG